MSNRKFSSSECIEYMEKKYGEEFYYISDYNQYQPTRSSYKIFVGSPGAKDKKIIVREEMFKNERFFNDNYVAIKYEDETRALLERIAGEVFEKCRVLYFSIDDVLTEKFDASITFEQFLSDECSRIVVNILLPESQSTERKEELMDSFYKALCANKIVAVISLCFFNDDKRYESVSYLPEVKLMLKEMKTSGTLFMNNQFEKTIEIWR